jgi:hypothetical protein
MEASNAQRITVSVGHIVANGAYVRWSSWSPLSGPTAFLALSAEVYDKFSPGPRPTGVSAIITDLLSRFCVRCTILASKLASIGGDGGEG